MIIMETALRCGSLVNLINAKKFTISTPTCFTCIARAEVFQPKNLACKAVPENPYLFDNLFSESVNHCPRAAHCYCLIR